MGMIIGSSMIIGTVHRTDTDIFDVCIIINIISININLNLYYFFRNSNIRSLQRILRKINYGIL